MKKVLHVIESFGVGGAEILLVNTIRDLTMFENHLIIMGKPDDMIKHVPVNCKVTELNFKSYKNILTVTAQIRKYIRKNDIDIVHSHLYWANIAARLACPKNIRLINTIHAISSEAAYKLNRLTVYIEKFTYKKRHYIVGVSSEVLKDFDAWVGLKGGSSVIYNMVDDVFFASEPKKDFKAGELKLVAVGNLREQKNYGYMVKVFRDLPPTISLDIYGEGVLRKELQEEIDKYKLNVTLKGLTGNMEKVLRNYDALVMTSFYEGMPLALMEAMAMGLPVVLSDITVLKESAGTTAPLYFGLDDTQNLSNLLKDMLAGKYDLQRMSCESMKAARAIAKREAFMKRIINLYRE